MDEKKNQSLQRRLANIELSMQQANACLETLKAKYAELLAQGETAQAEQLGTGIDELTENLEQLTELTKRLLTNSQNKSKGEA